MSDEKLAAARMSDVLCNLEDAMAKLAMAAEDLAIVDASLIGSDAKRRLIVESSALKPIETADDIQSHQAQAVEIAAMAADVAKCAKAVKDKAGFLGLALGSVYHEELAAGDQERQKQKDRKQPKLFEDGAE
ncbi:MAG: hypothetical protein RJA34_2517 [Pseudomonadota bacterium]|jgi:hypothetical protein